MKIDTDVHPQQGQALKLLNDGRTMYVLFGGGAGGGKSWLGCLWLIINALQYPGTRWFIGRQELKAILNSTLLTFYKVASHLGVADKFKFNAQYHFIRFGNGSRIDLLEMRYYPTDPFYERFGSFEYTGGFIEEGGETRFDAFDVLKSRIGRQANDKYNLLGKMLITANPKRNWLYTKIYKPWKNGTLSSEYAFVPSLITDNPFRESGALKGLQEIDSETTKARLLYGNWEYEDDPEQLIKYEWVEAALDVEPRRGSKKLGVDIARFGDDDSVLMYMAGNDICEARSWHGQDTVQTANEIEEFAADYRIDHDNIAVDVVGLGAGTVDALASRDVYVTEVVSGAKQVTEDSSFEYKDLRSQMWWKMRHDLRQGNIRISIADEDVREKLIEDLTSPRYKISAEKQVQVESKDAIKKRIGRSTDYGDPAVYANFVENLNTVDLFTIV